MDNDELGNPRMLWRHKETHEVCERTTMFPRDDDGYRVASQHDHVEQSNGSTNGTAAAAYGVDVIGRELKHVIDHDHQSDDNIY